MIRHMIFWNLAPSVTNKLAVIGDIQRRFVELAGKVDGLVNYTIDGDLGFGTHDVGLYCEFESWTALRNYYAHPLQMAFRAETKEILLDRSCIDLEVSQ